MSTDSSRLQVPAGSVDPDVTQRSGDTAATTAPMQGRRRDARSGPAVDATPTRRKRPAGSDNSRPPSAGAPGPGRRSTPSRRKRKVRKVHRVVRHIEVWSVAKLAAIFVACGYVVAMVSGYLLWRAADRVGTIDGIEGFMEDSGGYERFEILGDVVFRAAAGIGVVLAVLTVFVIVLGVVLFNLISDLTGGIRMTAIDEDLVVTPARRPTGPPRTADGGDGGDGRAPGRIDPPEPRPA